MDTGYLDCALTVAQYGAMMYCVFMLLSTYSHTAKRSHLRRAEGEEQKMFPTYFHTAKQSHLNAPPTDRRPRLRTKDVRLSKD